MKNLKLSSIRRIFNFCQENCIDFRETFENIANGADDFEVNDYRFISETEIDEIQVKELESDPYILGCFNADFIADNTDLSCDIVTALQEAEKYDAIGRHIIDNGYTDTIQEEYSRLDGYGHYFSPYDGATLEDLIGLNEEYSYYVFRLN